MVAENIGLVDVNRITDKLIEKGVIFAEDPNDENDEEEIDRTRTNYESIFKEVLSISPTLSYLIDYIKDIRPPQFREWHILIPQAQEGNYYARNRLFDMYLRKVVHLALTSFQNEGYELDDLIQEGGLGLLRAIDRYDSGKHGSFVSYMPWWITQHMSRAICDKDRLIRIPVHALETLRKLNKITEELAERLGREPSTREIAAFSEFSETEINTMLEQSQLPISLDKMVKKSGDGFLEFNIPDKQSPTVADIIYEDALHEVMNKVLKSLSEKEERVLRLRFGFFDGNVRTLEEIAAEYNVTRERVRQIESTALRKLHTPQNLREFSELFYPRKEIKARD
jgi:RNA polymerase primary sigma factor